MPFYGYNRPDAKVSEGVRESFWLQGMMAGMPASYFCIKAFSETDQTEDLKKIDKPTLILHGDDDQIVPIGASAMLSSKLVKGATLKVYKGAPHGMCTTQKNEVNADLLRADRRAPRRHWRGVPCSLVKNAPRSLHSAILMSVNRDRPGQRGRPRVVRAGPAVRRRRSIALQNPELREGKMSNPVLANKMLTIGVIGGSGDLATAEYYKAINKAVNDRLGGQQQAYGILHSMDFPNSIHYLYADLRAEAPLYTHTNIA